MIKKPKMHLTIRLIKLRPFCSGLKMLSSASLQSQLKLKIDTFILGLLFVQMLNGQGTKNKVPIYVSSHELHWLRTFTWATQKRVILARMSIYL